MCPRGGVVTQRVANLCTAGSSPARGLQKIRRYISGSADAGHGLHLRWIGFALATVGLLILAPSGACWLDP